MTPPWVLTDLRAAVQMVQVHHGWLGLLGSPVGPLPMSAVERPVFLSRLAEAFYTKWFTRSGAVGGTSRSAELPGIVTSVRAAHAASERFATGWVVTAVGARGEVLAAKDGETARLWPLDYANLARPGAPARAGDPLAVTMRKDCLDPTAGWWVTWGADQAIDVASQVRLYWNCGPDAVGLLVRHVTAFFEDGGLPYSMKCPSEAALFDRLDPVVLYLSADVWRRARSGLRAVHGAVAARLRPAVPPLTLRLGRGASVAEDPLDGRSFGQSRADAVAEGTLQALEARVTSAEAAVDWLAGALQARGVSPLRPHLRAASRPDDLGSW